MVENVDYFKIIIIGSAGVGKTCIMKRITNGKFDPSTLSTTGVEFETTKFEEVLDVTGKPVTLQIWDTAGQERFRSISRAYFRNAVGALLVFSLTEKESFDDVSGWLYDARTLCAQDAEIILIGNKCDEIENRVISLKEAQEFADLQRITYIETSAKEGVNIREAFIRAAQEILKKAQENLSSIGNKALIVTEEEEKKGCC